MMIEEARISDYDYLAVDKIKTPLFTFNFKAKKYGFIQ